MSSCNRRWGFYPQSIPKPPKISENANEVVNWQSSSVVQAVRDNAD